MECVSQATLNLPLTLPTRQYCCMQIRGLVFINPGNPTGQCLSKDNLQDLIKFAYEERVALMCDEVYQENIYQVSPGMSVFSLTCVLC